MHELGIVFHIIKTVEHVGEEQQLKCVSMVKLELGEVSGVVEKELTDCWNWAVQKTTLLSKAELIVETVPAETLCEDCQQRYSTTAYGRICPSCGSERTHLVQGNEMNIKEIAAC